ncbi:MAG: hypothetical protein JWQ40_4484 [Segetibacter sp.]|nr:hypothetical protein [Segetibacter sp.]
MRFVITIIDLVIMMQPVYSQAGKTTAYTGLKAQVHFGVHLCT